MLLFSLSASLCLCLSLSLSVCLSVSFINRYHCIGSTVLRAKAFSASSTCRVVNNRDMTRVEYAGAGGVREGGGTENGN